MEAHTKNLSVSAQLEPLWDETVGDPGVCIAILDGPVDRSHDCFSGAKLSEIGTLASRDADQGAASRHGTHVASIIFGQTGGPIQGIAPGCRGLIVPVFSDGPNGSVAPCSQLDLARAITQAVQNGANIINISGGQLKPSAEAEEWLVKAIKFCAEEDVLVVAAAGNEGCECLHVPAAVPSVLAVGAADAHGSPVQSSNWGASYQTQGILAQGKDIPGAIPGGSTTAGTGTSFATPVVAGVAGLLLSLQLKRGEKADPQAVRQALLESAIPCNPQEASDCRRFLVGHLNISGAVGLIEEGTRKALPGQTSEPEPEVEVSPTAQPGTKQAAKSVFAAVDPAPHSEADQSLVEPRSRSPGHEMTSTPRIPVEEEYEYITEGETQKMPDENSETVEVQPSDGILKPEEEESPQPSSSAEPPQANALTPSGESASAPSQNATSTAASTSVYPSACGCGGGGAPSLVYALGQLGHDFGTEARRDSFVQHGVSNPDDPAGLLGHLEEHPSRATAVTWTLTQETTPIYAIQPAGPYAAETYQRVQEFYNGQLNEGVERVSIPGWVAGKVTLLNGQAVPVIVPELRGMGSWSTAVLIKAVAGDAPGKDAKKDQVDQFHQKTAGIRNFLDRVYYELRNLGLTSQERAVNYAATNAFNIERVFESASGQDLELDSIDVEPSPISRPDSDCWDVKVTFFNPAKRTEQARVVYRFTVDVSDVVPVTVGAVRKWSVY